MLHAGVTSLKNSYLFEEIEKRKQKHSEKNPSREILNLGIGDIAYPLPEIIANVMREAIDELQQSPHGYPPASGYSFLKEKIKEIFYPNDSISAQEIFISNGSKNDAAMLCHLFSNQIKVALANPIYPVYRDAPMLFGFNHLHFLPCLEEHNFLPTPPSFPVSLIFLCSPNNPTGTAFSHKALQQWVDYALTNKALIIYDTAYYPFIKEKTPKSIYEIENADQVAIELRSFSKAAGFTNLRCSSLVIPKALRVDGHMLCKLWERRLASTFGGVPYPIQKAAFATLFGEGKKAVDAIIDLYRGNSLLLSEALRQRNQTFVGGENSPFLWWKIPKNFSSWGFFEKLLTELDMITIPGSGFGEYGEGYVRLSSFNIRENIELAAKRLACLI